MLYYNKATLVGNLTRDPELRSLPSGTKMTTFSVATNRVYKDRDGNRQENTDFHNIVVFGPQAENCAQYLKKGQQVLTEGRMQTRSWDDQTTGQKKYRTEIVADRVQFGLKSNAPAGADQDRAEDQSQSAQSQPAAGPNESNKKSTAVSEEAIDYPEEEINPEDIPF